MQPLDMRHWLGGEGRLGRLLMEGLEQTPSWISNRAINEGDKTIGWELRRIRKIDRTNQEVHLYSRSAANVREIYPVGQGESSSFQTGPSSKTG